MKKLIVRYWKSILVAAGIFYLSVMHVPEVKPLEKIPNFDKGVHWLMYMVLSVVLFFEYMKDRDFHAHKTIFVAILIPIIYGGLIEIIQGTCTQNRTGSWLDLLADAVGAIIGFIIVYFYHKKRT